MGSGPNHPGFLFSRTTPVVGQSYGIQQAFNVWIGRPRLLDGQARPRPRPSPGRISWISISICLLLCVVWVKRRVCHSTRRQPLLQFIVED